MNEQHAPRYGAPIERGILAEETPEGWRVKSADRPGILTPPLPIPGAHSAGEIVFFFLFEDGTGGILGRA